MKLRKIIAVVFCLLFVLSIGALAAYRRGDSGETVKSIQTRLKRWGYYNGAIDGIYGSRTEKAVRLFQQKNGLKVDGICGSETMAALGLSSASSSTGSNDFYLLSRMIAAEARGEPYVGQVAVGAVILNRVKHPSFPNTIAGVIYQKGAFTATVDGQINVPISENSSVYKACRDAMNGWDPTGGAIYYYNPKKTTNQWIYSREVIKIIGSHRFAR